MTNNQSMVHDSTPRHMRVGDIGLWAGLVLVALSLGTLTGCGPAAAKLVPAKGTITIKGKPAANISIQFMPDIKEETDGAFPTSSAISKEDGSFELMTNDNQPGAVPGPHRVVLADLEEERVEQGKQSTKPPRLDPKYVVAGALKVTVKDGEPISIEIK